VVHDRSEVLNMAGAQRDFSDRSIAYEDYGGDIFEKIDWSALHSEMSSTERRFVNGLIRYFTPENVLEVGVSLGGGTVNILNSIGDDPQASLVSIDRSSVWWNDKKTPVAADAYKTFPDLPAEKWKLILDKDPSEVLASLGKTFDFAIIDTAHLHPVESLNFLCVLPFLRDGAIVVLHDTSLMIRVRKCLASRILLSSVAAEKCFPREGDHPGLGGVANIAALRICADTKRYISDAFEALMIPWATFPESDVENVRAFLMQHYDDYCLGVYDTAVSLNRRWLHQSATEKMLRRCYGALRSAKVRLTHS
jgi:hypothetical protein